MKKIDYKPKQIRLFLVLLWIFLGLVIFRFMEDKSSTTRLWILATQTAIIILFFFAPKLFFPLFKVILTGSYYLSVVVFGVLGVITFYLIMTPISCVMRLFGKKFMESAINPSQTSYYLGEMKEHNIKKQF